MVEVGVSCNEYIGEEGELEKELNMDKAGITFNEFCQDVKYVKNWE